MRGRNPGEVAPILRGKRQVNPARPVLGRIHREQGSHPPPARMARLRGGGLDLSECREGPAANGGVGLPEHAGQHFQETRVASFSHHPGGRQTEGPRLAGSHLEHQRNRGAVTQPVQGAGANPRVRFVQAILQPFDAPVAASHQDHNLRPQSGIGGAQQPRQGREDAGAIRDGRQDLGQARHVRRTRTVDVESRSVRQFLRQRDIDLRIDPRSRPRQRHRLLLVQRRIAQKRGQDPAGGQQRQHALGSAGVFAFQDLDRMSAELPGVFVE